jgi:hypothetical protein
MSQATKARGPLRIKFEKQSEDCVTSVNMYSDGKRLVRIKLNPVAMRWYIIDAATGHEYISGGDNITNYEVLQRNAKKALAKFIGTEFERERRTVPKSKYSLR